MGFWYELLPTAALQDQMPRPRAGLFLSTISQNIVNLKTIKFSGFGTGFDISLSVRMRRIRSWIWRWWCIDDYIADDDDENDYDDDDKSKWSFDISLLDRVMDKWAESLLTGDRWPLWNPANAHNLANTNTQTYTNTLTTKNWIKLQTDLRIQWTDDHFGIL